MGISLMQFPRFRIFARWSALVLLIGTLPAAIDQIIHPEAIASVGLSPTLAIVRSIVQCMVIGVIWWITEPQGQDQKRLK